jgi:ribonuclease HI
VDLTWGVDESLFPIIIAPRLLGEVLGELQVPTTIYTDGSKTEGLVGIGIFLDYRDSYRFRLPGHCGIFTAEMCAIHSSCDLIESKEVGAYIILTDSLASIEGLKSTGIFYRTNDMLFRTRRSLRYLGELGYDISLMWIPSHVGIKRNKRADILANEGSISRTTRTLFQDRTGLTTVNTSDIHTRARTRMLTEWQERWNDSEMGRYCYSVVPAVSVEAWMASAVDERVFLVAMSRLTSNHTGTRGHFRRINVVGNALCQCAMGYDTIDHGLWECGLKKHSGLPG